MHIGVGFAVCTKFFVLMQNVRQYLAAYNIPSNVKLSDPIWKEFITAVVSRFKCASNHDYLMDLLQNVGQKYVDEKKPVPFIIDLMKLKVTNLLCGRYTVRLYSLNRLRTLKLTPPHLNSNPGGD